MGYWENEPVIFDLPDNLIPDEVYRLSRERQVFVRDHQTGELIQILDLTED